MTRIYVGPTSLYSLGQVGELALLSAFDGDIVIPEPVIEAVPVEPAATNLTELLDDNSVETAVDSGHLDRARSVLGRKDIGPAETILAGVLAHRDPSDRSAVAVVSEDRTVRRTAQGLGAAVTSSFGVVVRAAIEDKYLSSSQAKRIVRRIDTHGTHLTGEPRERAVGEVAE
jgi:predicted nucleic acid-binding protein